MTSIAGAQIMGDNYVAKETTKQKKKGGVGRFIVGIALAGAVIYLVAALVSGRMQMASMQADLDAIEKQTQQMEALNAELQELADSGDVDAYIERVAREKLGYVRPGDRVFVDMTGQ